MIESEISYEQYALLSNALAWYLKMGALRFTNKSAKEIAELAIASCPFDIDPTEIQSALDLLEANKAVRKEEAVYVFDLDNLKTEWDFDDKKIKQFHYNNLMLAIHSIPWPIAKRFFSNVTIPCNAELFEIAKKEIRDLCLKLLNLSNNQITNSEECQQVVSLQFAMFPYFVFHEK